jgi:hypothetical protein
VHVSFEPHAPSPHPAQKPQSAGQLVHVSPMPGSQILSPQSDVMPVLDEVCSDPTTNVRPQPAAVSPASETTVRAAAKARAAKDQREASDMSDLECDQESGALR